MRPRRSWGMSCGPSVIGRWSVGILALLASCRSIPPAQTAAGRAGHPPAVRFLLTFDDGPSIRQPFNPTLAIVSQLATNDVQPDIKAVFFVQTGHPRGGGTPQGREVMRQVAGQGHTLGIHSVSPLGHISHTSVSTNELASSLRGAQELLRQVTGLNPLFVRPPFGAYNLATRAVYADAGLCMLMADIRARDGIIYGYRGSLTRRIHIRHALAEIRRSMDARAPQDDPVPVIINFHDVNPYTARHMTEYLHILVEEARRAGFAVLAKPFYDSTAEVVEVGICRSIPGPREARASVRVAGAQREHNPEPDGPPAHF